MPADVIALAPWGEQKAAIAKYRELTGAGLQEALEALKGL